MSGAPSGPEPGGYERAYAESYRLAFERLCQSDLGAVCARSGAAPAGADAVCLRFLARDFLIDRQAGEVTPLPGVEPPTVAEKLLMLHYLVTARGTAPRDEAVSFQDLPEGLVYYPTFTKRAIRPVVAKFGASPDGLVAAAARLGGVRTELGDAGVVIRAFPRVTLTWVLWGGDDEFPAAGNLLVDRSISDYLPTEDIAVLCQLVAHKLMALAA